MTAATILEEYQKQNHPNPLYQGGIETIQPSSHPANQLFHIYIFEKNKTPGNKVIIS
jgi:hypothetical protein